MNSDSPRKSVARDRLDRAAATEHQKMSEDQSTSSNTSTPTETPSPSMLVSGSVSERTLNGVDGVQHSSSTSRSMASGSGSRSIDDRSSIRLEIQYRGYMNTEQSAKWAKDLERRLKTIMAIPEEDRDTLVVSMKSCVEPPRAL